MDFVITSNQIMGFCAFVVALYGVWKIIKELRKPNESLKEEVETHDRLIKRDNERLTEIEDSDKMVLQCLLVIINHEITGNGIEKMKEARDELQDFLIRK